MSLQRKDKNNHKIQSTFIDQTMELIANINQLEKLGTIILLTFQVQIFTFSNCEVKIKSLKIVSSFLGVKRYEERH